MTTAVTRAFAFVGGTSGTWQVVGTTTVVGESIAAIAGLSIVPDPPDRPIAGTAWVLRGITSHERYVNRAEKDELGRQPPVLGRREASSAALILIRKNPAWWSLPQDERRRIFEEDSHHIRIGLPYLPAVARRLHHCRDISPHEPFDFLTWFEFAPAHAAQFEELLARLRSTREWSFVEREVDLRLERS